MRGRTISGRLNAILDGKTVHGMPFGNEAGRPISRNNSWVKGKMNMPPTTSTAMAPVDDCHVAVAAEAIGHR